MKDNKKKLLAYLEKLSEEDSHALLSFAEFLADKAVSQPGIIPAPEKIERPENESVVKAIKRLSATYPMLDKTKILNETSLLMAEHVVQGRDAKEVIDEMELLFRRYYKDLTEK